MSTHIDAKDGAIAKKVLLPGDPLRAKYIAETFLTDVTCYNQVRNMLGYTGYYNGGQVSVQGTGMGGPSLSIYVNELIRFYGVTTLIRVGTCGSMSKDLKLKDTFMALSSATDSNMNNERFGHINYPPTASFALTHRAYHVAKEAGIELKPGIVYSADKFYDDNLQAKIELLSRHGVTAVEMECAELYTLASKYGADALTLLTVSDSLITHEATSALERQTTFNDMIRIALEI